jgi:hypothetical protein
MEFSFDESPNLFKFATSELSQDAFLCWLFEHIRLKTNGIVYEVANDLLNLIIKKFNEGNSDLPVSDLTDYSLVIDQQVHNIDVLLTFESKGNSEKIYIIIEDKISSGESRKNQPEYYADKLKVKDSKAIIIPVLFKTGYATANEQEKFEDRKVIFIGYHDIYQLFSYYIYEMQENIILSSWWTNFYSKYYAPIELANGYTINPTVTLKELNRIVKKQLFPETIVFRKISDYLFDDISQGFLTNMYSVQGKGHIDWHFELSKENWLDKEKNIAVSLYFIWDTYDFSLVVKTSPFQYKPRKKLTDSERKEYITTQETIKTEIKRVKHINWKLTNYYLQIAQMNGIQSIPMDHLKRKIKEEIYQISTEIDKIMGL